MLTAVPAIAISAVAPLVIAYVSATVEWYSGERERLISLAAEQEAERLRAVGALDALRDVSLFAVQRDVATARSVLDDSERAPGDVADALLIAARTGVRPAAHSLMGRAPRRSRTAPFREAIRSEVLRAPLPLLLPALALPIMTGPRIALRFGTTAAVLGCALFIACMLVVFPIGRRLIRRWPLRALGITAIACIITPLPTVVLVTAVFGATAPIALAIATALLLTVLVLASSMPRVVDARSEAALAAMAEPAHSAEIERLAAERAQEALLREIGSHLHGKVQTGLIAASYAIQDALAREDAAALEVAIAQARSALAQRITPGPADDDATQDPRDLIDREWRGLLRISWEGSTENLPRDGGVVDVVRECLANAVVHGRATKASIRIEEAPDALIVEIEDDGSGPADGPPGHGAAVLDDATARRWAITRAPSGGSLVRARIDI